MFICQAIIRKLFISMEKCFLFITLFTVLLCGFNCSESGNLANIPAGEIKISCLVITQGMLKKETNASYLALVSREWWAQRKRKLNEPFELLKLPPGYPAVKIAPDDAILEILELLEKEGFYSLKSTNLKQFTIAEMERLDFKIHILTIEHNGLSYSVSLENLLPENRNNFSRIKNIFLNNYHHVNGWKTEINYEQDWNNILKNQPKGQQDKNGEKKD